MEKLYTRPTEDGLAHFTGPIEAPRLTQAGLFDFGRRKAPSPKKSLKGTNVKKGFLQAPKSSSLTTIVTSTKKARVAHTFVSSGG